MYLLACIASTSFVFGAFILLTWHGSIDLRIGLTGATVGYEGLAVMSASKKPVRARCAKPRKPPKAPKVLPDLQEILGAFSDATDFVKVVYAAFEINGRDGPEQSVLCQAVKDLDNAYEKLVAVAHELEISREWNSRIVRGAS